MPQALDVFEELDQIDSVDTDMDNLLDSEEDYNSEEDYEFFDDTYNEYNDDGDYDHSYINENFDGY